MCLQEKKIELIMHMRQSGIRDIAVLNAIERIPREFFIPPLFHSRAYDDAALPIGLGQTISQPMVVATMTQSLMLKPHHNVLEIGTGSGYQAAVLSQICKRVYSLERHRPLLEIAEERFKELRLRNIITMTGDGMRGWAQIAPFDRIIVTAAANGDIPRKLIDQLAPGGIMIVPVGDDEATQTLRRITKDENGAVEIHTLCPVKFVPLLPDIARETLKVEADMNQLLAW